MRAVCSDSDADLDCMKYDIHIPHLVWNVVVEFCIM